MADKFTANKFLGYGCYSFVFSVTSKQHFDRGQSYAMKRFFPSCAAAIRNGVREIEILKRITTDPESSPFLPTLYYTLAIHDSPTLVMTETLGISLYNFVRINGDLTLDEAKFFMCEMISGLKFLHTINIVHMEFKINNILLTKQGHIMISDFDRSIDLSFHRRRDFTTDFNVNLDFAAPEIANKEEITTKADVWSFGVVTSFMIGKFIRPLKLSEKEVVELAKSGYWHIDGYQYLPECWRDFFTKVFTKNHRERPGIEEVQLLPLFQDVDWRQVNNLRLESPFTQQFLTQIADEDRFNFDPKCPEILNCLFSYHMPKIKSCKIQMKENEDGTSSFILIPPEYRDLTRSEVDYVVANCNFIHPYLNYRKHTAS